METLNINQKNSKREKVVSVTDIGRKGIDPPETDKGAILRTDNDRMHYLEDDLVLYEIGCMKDDFMPEQFNDYESESIRGFLEGSQLEVEEVNLGGEKDGITAGKTNIIVEGDFIENIEPHTALLYGINSYANITIDQEALIDADTFNARYSNDLEWRGIDDREWVEVDDRVIEPELKSLKGEYARASFEGYGLKKLDIDPMKREIPGFELSSEEGDIFVPDKPLDKQLSSKVYINSEDDKLRPQDIRTKDNTTLPVYLIHKFDIDVKPLLGLGGVELNYDGRKADMNEDFRTPRELYLDFEEGAVSVPFSGRSEGLKDWPYSDRASEYISWLSSTENISDIDIEFDPEYSEDFVLNDSLRDDDQRAFMQDSKFLGSAEGSWRRDKDYESVAEDRMFY